MPRFESAAEAISGPGFRACERKPGSRGSFPDSDPSRAQATARITRRAKAMGSARGCRQRADRQRRGSQRPKIFSRLVTDTQFRAVATRLLERYGYLVPKINPESDAGEERRLVLQARANQLAQEQNQQVETQLPPGNRLAVPYQQTRDCVDSGPQGLQNGQSSDQNRERLRNPQASSQSYADSCPHPSSSLVAIKTAIF